MYEHWALKALQQSKSTLNLYYNDIWQYESKQFTNAQMLDRMCWFKCCFFTFIEVVKSTTTKMSKVQQTFEMICI